MVGQPMGSLRRQTLTMVAAILACCVVVGYFVSDRIMDRSFREFEARDATQALERARILMRERMASLKKQARDYAVWRQTYDYMRSADSGYVEDNLPIDALQNFDMDFIALINVAGVPILALADPAALGAPGPELVPWTGTLRDELLSSDAVKMVSESADEVASGTLRFVGDQAYLIGISTILNNDGKGAVRGALVWARRLDQNRLGYLKEMAQAEFSIVPPPTGPPLRQVQFASNTVSAALPLTDEAGQSVAILKVTAPRALLAQNSMLQLLGLLNILGLTVIALPLAYLVFDRTVLRKVSALIADIVAVRKSPEQPLHLPRRGDDEIDRIAGEVNQLLDELRRSQNQLRHDAMHDALTGLGNRQALLMHLAASQAALSADRLPRFALLLIDLDNFKDINDLHGHLLGDEVLVRISHRLEASIAVADSAVRLGGDEFAVVLTSPTHASPDVFAQRLLSLIAQSIECGGQALQVQASIGILNIDARNLGDRPEDLLRKVDIAMYAAKHAGRNGYCYFNDALQRNLSERKALEQSLHEAMEHDSLEVWYQPIFNREGQFAGVEALSRWSLPGLGSITPDVFVPIAEELRTIHRLDMSVLRKAIAVLATLRTLEPAATLSVNCSAMTLMLPQIPTFVDELLRRHELPGSSLLLELTETVLARNERDLHAPMKALRALGVRFQIDDFGTGYSSLSRLHALPLDIVKIDRSFVAELGRGDDRICPSIIRLAHSLNMQVTAEGVETIYQRDALVDLGCDFLQGYWYCRPLPSAELLAKLHKPGSLGVRRGGPIG